MAEWQIVLTLVAAWLLGPILVIAHMFLFEDRESDRG